MQTPPKVKGYITWSLTPPLGGLHIEHHLQLIKKLDEAAVLLGEKPDRIICGIESWCKIAILPQYTYNPARLWYDQYCGEIQLESGNIPVYRTNDNDNNRSCWVCHDNTVVILLITA